MSIKIVDSITSTQCGAARSLLEIAQNDLAEAAKLGAGIAGAFQVATGYGGIEHQLAAILGSPGFEVRFEQTIAGALTLPISMPQDGA
jgi:hypothetical protein